MAGHSADITKMFWHGRPLLDLSKEELTSIIATQRTQFDKLWDSFERMADLNMKLLDPDTA